MGNSPVAETGSLSVIRRAYVLAYGRVGAYGANPGGTAEVRIAFVPADREICCDRGVFYLQI